MGFRKSTEWYLHLIKSFIFYFIMIPRLSGIMSMIIEFYGKLYERVFLSYQYKINMRSIHFSCHLPRSPYKAPYVMPSSFFNSYYISESYLGTDYIIFILYIFTESLEKYLFTWGHKVAYIIKAFSIYSKHCIIISSCIWHKKYFSKQKRATMRSMFAKTTFLYNLGLKKGRAT